jgi:hypothetical protein
LPISPPYALTAGNLMSQAKRSGKPIAATPPGEGRVDPRPRGAAVSLGRACPPGQDPSVAKVPSSMPPTAGIPAASFPAHDAGSDR